MKYLTQRRFLKESIDFTSDVDGIDTERRQPEMSAEPARDLSNLSIADVKQMFQAGELDYDTLLKFLMSDQGDGELDDMQPEDEFDQEDDLDIRADDDRMQESAPPGEEDWIKKMKPDFIKRYGAKKGMEALYATAWKRHKVVKEAWDDGEDYDDDSLSSAERELIAKSDRALKKRGVKVDDFDPDEVEKKPMRKAPAKAEKETEAEPKEKPKADAEKKEAPTRTRGKPIGERGGNIRTWFKENPNAPRKEFMAKAADLGMGAKHANTLYYSLKRKVSECFFIGMDGKYLTEGSSLVSPKFIDLADQGDLLVFENKRDAYRMVDILRASGKAVFVI